MNCDKPVNIRETGQVCKEECSYQYNYSPNSSVIVKNEGDYLDIKVDGKNTVKFNGYQVHLDQSKGGAVKIFQPSVHLFGGQQADGEIIISHSSSDNRVLVCIPITIKDGAGNSNTFFSKIIPHINLAEGNPEPQNVNVSKWSLNDIMSTGDFHFYNGALPFHPCTKNINSRINVIVFGIESAATINKKDYTLLQSLINPITYSQIEMLNSVANKVPLIMMNKAGEQGGGAQGPHSQKGEYTIFENCEYIDGMGEKDKPKKAADMSGWIIALIVIIGLIILFALAYTFFKHKNSNNTGGTEGTGTGGKGVKQTTVLAGQQKPGLKT